MVLRGNQAVENYMQVLRRNAIKNFPELKPFEIDEAIDYSITKRYTEQLCILDNNYTKKTAEVTLDKMTRYIMDKQPITTSFGVLYRKHGEIPNPLVDMIMGFLDSRGVAKKTMFKYPKGSAMFEKYNLMQLLYKLDANATYGAMTNNSSIYYNLYVGASIPYQGRALISSATLFFEGFLSNNVKYASLDDVIMFIDNVVSEKPKRKYSDNAILDDNITAAECFNKIVLTIGDFRKGTFKWLPDERDLDIIWNIINKLDQEDLNRLYYKNNLYSFMDNKSMSKAIVYILKALKKPFLDPNKVPKEIKEELDVLLDILKEYVYYSYQYVDRIDRNENMIKNVCMVSDTDSSIVSLDAWYRFALEKVRGIDLEINKITVDPIAFFKTDEFGDVIDPIHPVYFEDEKLDYDFMEDEIIEMKRLINPIEIIPYDNLRFSIINIMAYILGELVNDYMIEFTKNSYSYGPNRKCLIYMKNEFLFKRLAMTMKKKNYASIQQLQEGNLINGGAGMMDIKGLPITKSTLNPATKDALQKILYEDILNTPVIDQVKIIKDLAILEKKIFQSLNSGNKEYYKPLQVKAMSSYSDPMRIQGIKASVVWNALRGDELEAIDLDARNSIDVVKVVINAKTVENIKDKYPDVYQRAVALLSDRSVFGDKSNYNRNEITSIAIPTDVNTPQWVMEFIDYVSIINDNLCNFPTDIVNIETFEDTSTNYSTCMQL